MDFDAVWMDVWGILEGNALMEFEWIVDGCLNGFWMELNDSWRNFNGIGMEFNDAWMDFNGPWAMDVDGIYSR
jgi:hypothetical protein